MIWLSCYPFQVSFFSAHRGRSAWHSGRKQVRFSWVTPWSVHISPTWPPGKRQRHVVCLNIFFGLMDPSGRSCLLRPIGIIPNFDAGFWTLWIT